MNNTSQAKAYTHEHLLQFYKRIFGFFYGQAHLPASIDRKFNKFSHFLNRNNLTFSMVYSMCMLWILHWSYCQSRKGLWIRTSLFMILNSFGTSISVLSFLFRFENVKFFWTEMKCLDRLIYKRLHFSVNYFEFRRSFIIGTVVFPLLMLICSMCVAIKSPISNKQKTDISIRFVQFYVETHTIFVIGLFQHTYKTFVISIDVACRFRRSKSIAKNANRIDAMIRHSKEIHYKIWLISHEVNNIFGPSIIAFSLQSFFEVTRFLCYIFHRWDDDVHDDDDIFSLTSKHFIVSPLLRIRSKRIGKSIENAHVSEMRSKVFVLLFVLGPMFNVLSTITTTTILVNACHYCNQQVLTFDLSRKVNNLHYDAHSIIVIQKYGLIKNLEKLSFWSADNQKLHFDKRELLAQINNLNVSINGIGFFTIDRPFLARVSFPQEVGIIMCQRLGFELSEEIYY